MKISKLFHWLYAFLMLLPVFFVLGKGLYVTFNQNAKDSFYGTTINEEQYVNIDFNDLVPNKTYYFISTQFAYEDTTYVRLNVSNVVRNNVSMPSVNNMRLQALNNINYIFFYNGNTYVGETNLNSSNVEIEFTFENYVNITNYSSILNKYFEIQYNKYSYLDNAISYGMYELNESVLFSWAKDSFLSVPIKYISNLFGMPTNNSILTALSYWLDISLIWLTFDVIMYVPLLVHRWLDKGVIE